MLTAGVELLKHISLATHAEIIEKAINITVNDEKIQTADLNPEFPVGTNEVVESIVRNVQNLAAWKVCKESCVSSDSMFQPAYV